MMALPSPNQVTTPSPIFQAPTALMFLLGGYMVLCVGRALFRFRGQRLGAGVVNKGPGGIIDRVWSPRTATLVIGITFFFVLMMMGAGAYTDLLADLASGKGKNLLTRSLLLVALLLGATLGGWSAGLLRYTPVTAKQAVKCFVGGVLMAWGSLLIPGSNDGLILGTSD